VNVSFVDASIFDDNLSLFDSNCGSQPGDQIAAARGAPLPSALLSCIRRSRDLRAPIRATVLDDIPARRRLWSILLFLKGLYDVDYG
jgi:hypothetical protein